MATNEKDKAMNEIPASQNAPARSSIASIGGRPPRLRLERSQQCATTNALRTLAGRAVDGSRHPLRATAYHEAGHAVVTFKYGKSFEERVSPSISTSPATAITDTRPEILLPHTVAMDFDANTPVEGVSFARANQRRLRAGCPVRLAGYASEQKALRH